MAVTLRAPMPISSPVLTFTTSPFGVLIHRRIWLHPRETKRRIPIFLSFLAGSHFERQRRRHRGQTEQHHAQDNLLVMLFNEIHGFMLLRASDEPNPP